MATFYDVPVKWKNRPDTKGRGIGNNAAWLCECGEILLGPHEALYKVPPCTCGRHFRIVRGKEPRFVASIIDLGVKG